MIWGAIKEVITGVSDGYKAKQELKKTVIQEKTRLISEKEKNNSSWEINALINSGKSLKWASFFLFAAPIVLTVLLTLIGQEERVFVMWDAFDKVPEAWLQVYFIITGSIWGVASLKDAGGEFMNVINRWIDKK